MLSVGVRLTVLTHDKVDQALSSAVAGVQADADGLFVEIMEGDQRVVPPFVSDCQDIRGVAIQDLVIPPSEFRTLFSEADHAFGPVQHGIWVAALRLDIDAAVTPGTLANNGQYGLLSR